MAIDRMKGKRWLTGDTYTTQKEKVYWKDYEEVFPEEYPKDSTVSLTVPGQAISIKNLMDRYEKGRPIPVE